MMLKWGQIDFFVFPPKCYKTHDGNASVKIQYLMLNYLKQDSTVKLDDIIIEKFWYYIRLRDNTDGLQEWRFEWVFVRICYK